MYPYQPEVSHPQPTLKTAETKQPESACSLLALLLLYKARFALIQQTEKSTIVLPSNAIDATSARENQQSQRSDRSLEGIQRETLKDLEG